MIKSIFISAALCLFVNQFKAQNNAITFEHGTFKEIKEKALKENKLIFIDAYTTWCGPCKQMAKNVFTDKDVAEYYNKNLVNAKIDMEKGEGIEIAKMYEVKCYPNLLFIDGNGNLIHRVAGSMTPTEFIALAEEAKNSEKNFSYFVKNYESNKTNTEFLKKYIEAKENTCLDGSDLVKDYFALQKEENLSNKSNWEMIHAHTNSMESNEYKYLVANKKKFDDLYNANIVNEKVDDIHRNTLYNIIKTKPLDEKLYSETKERILALKLEGTALVVFEADLRFARKKEDWKSFAKLAVENVDVFYKDNADMLNSISWDFYEKVDDKQALEKAESWAKKACEKDNSYPFLDTYAAVLYKLGKKQMALEIANKAIAMAKKDKMTAEDYQGTTDLLKKIKELK